MLAASLGSCGAGQQLEPAGDMVAHGGNKGRRPAALWRVVCEGLNRHPGLPRDHFSMALGSPWAA